MTSRLALGVILVGGGLLWLLSSTGVIDLSYQTWIGVLLIAIGLAIAFTPGRHGLLAALGVLVVLAGLPALVVDTNLLRGGVGDEIEAPSSPEAVTTYRQGIGKLTVDLTAPMLRTEDVAVEARLGIGELLVIVPFLSPVTVDAHVGIGNVETLGRSRSGIDVDVRESVEGIGGELALDLEAGIGNIRIQRG